jgi:hypothetical protein
MDNIIKDKAEELYEEFYEISCITPTAAKNCTLILLDILIEESQDDTFRLGRKGLSNKEFWKQVKNYIV